MLDLLGKSVILNFEAMNPFIQYTVLKNLRMLYIRLGEKIKAIPEHLADLNPNDLEELERRIEKALEVTMLRKKDEKDQ